ncbi:hypothetical protein [Asaia krungthepensis]|uniref:Uncharacterized protein n=1 Tax=Asaia krungthepensis NRIC 0535 TaxID=1307925 RepID=A0ABQ0Q5H3_9PROT|nr:hypothetical protein [Asaia krungthepensis]GBQ92392.1 hypothetical protein AA0535_2537 [Asaia krungthepensis NRIC 0535]
MTQYRADKESITDSKNSEYKDNIICFPTRLRHRNTNDREIPDPFIVVSTDDGRICDRLGMSGDECCYILPPRVNSVSFDFADTGSGLTDRQHGRRLPKLARVILSEADGISEIDVPMDGEFTTAQGGNMEMRWIIAGRKLILGRRTPEHVALLSLKLAIPEH